MDLIAPDLEAYFAAHSTPVGPLLDAVEADTRRQFADRQAMMVGPLEGRLLETLVFVSGARRVLEIGTFTGYSALSMAAALPPDGELVTCELDEEHAALARRHIEDSPFAGRISLRVGPALDTVADLAGPFDLVFIDADKSGYVAYYEAVLPKLAPRGLIVVDNTFFHGGAVSDAPGDAAGVRAFNDHVRADARVVAVMLSVRDGVTLIRRAP